MFSKLIPIGVALVAVMAVLARFDVRQNTEAVVVLCGIASVLYLAAAWFVSRKATENRRGLWLCLALALCMRIPLVPAEPTLSDDIYRYVWDGRIQEIGLNPYTAVPADPALAPLHTDVTRKMNHPSLPTLYPPVAEWIFRAIAAVQQSVLAFKLAFVALDVLIVLLLLDWLSLTGKSLWLILVYAWNPLVVLEVAGSGHLDVIGVFFVTLSLAALARRATWLAAVSLVAAIGVKFLPVVLLPLFWRKIRVRDAVLAGVFGLAVAAPFAIGAGALPIGSLPTYLAKWRFNGFVYGLFESVWRTRWLAGLPIVAGLTLAWRLQGRPQADQRVAWAWPLGIAVLLAPTIYPWYLLWLVPFLGALETFPLLVWTQSSLVTYYVWRMAASGAGWRLPWWATCIEYGTVAVAAVWVIHRTRRHQTEVH